MQTRSTCAGYDDDKHKNHKNHGRVLPTVTGSHIPPKGLAESRLAANTLYELRWYGRQSVRSDRHRLRHCPNTE